MDIGALGIYCCLFLALYFEVFLLISFFEKRPAQKTGVRPKHYPFVSMLVPCFNEERTVAGTLQSLLALEYPKDKLEILVIDDGSYDKTSQIAGQFVEKNNHIRFFHKENGGKYTAMNLGIKEARGQLIGCLDADSFVIKDALLEIVKRFEDDASIMAITPAMKVYRPKKLLELMQAVEYTFGIFYKKMFDNLSAVNVLPGPFSIYRKEVFERIGNFRHAHNTEDMEIAFRMHARGLKIVNAHTAAVYTTVPNTIRALLKQRTRWSQGFLQNLQDYRYMLGNPRYGNFGTLVLPFGLLGFAAGLYSALYALYRISDFLITRSLTMWMSGIPPHAPGIPHVDWFYINTGMMPLLIVAVLCMTLTAVVLGQRIGKTEISPKSLLSYFLFFGLLAPLWLARAVWGTLRAQESAWR